MLDPEKSMPKVVDSTSVTIAVILHAVLFAGLWLFSSCRSETPVEEDDEEVIPIDLLVVAQENLDGVEDEPPPIDPPVEEPPPDPLPVERPPEPPPVVEPPPPPPVMPPEIVEPPKEKPPEPPKVKPPEQPKETPEQIKARERKEREDRLRSMRDSAVPNKIPPQRTNGRTAQRPLNAADLLDKGYRPSNVNAGLDASEKARCEALIRQAFHDKWQPPPWTRDLRTMILEVHFDRTGRVVSYRLTRGSTNAKADATVLSAAGLVSRVPGLSASYLEKHPVVSVEFEVETL